MDAFARIREKDQEKQFLHEHLTSVARLASKYAEKIDMPKAGKLLGLLHDIGKYSSAFQQYLCSATGVIELDDEEYVDASSLKGKIDHSTAGAQWLLKTIDSKNPKEQIISQLLTLCLVSHHSGLIDCLNPDGENTYKKRVESSSEKTHYHEVAAKLEKKLLEELKQLVESKEPFSEIFSKFMKIVETKEKEKFPTTHFQLGLLARMLFSCLIDADRLDTAAFADPETYNKKTNGEFVGWETLITRFESKLNEIQDNNNIPINQIRKKVSVTCKEKANQTQGVFTLTVPTGGGKTLASLRFALHHAQKHNLDRIIYVIPYTTIIEQNAHVARGFLETEDDAGTVVLEHHSNLLPEKKTQLNKVLSENWDAPIVFTTMVQFLETIFGSGTRHARRMHQLAKSVIIFDEIQTLPVKTVHLFNNAVNFLTNHCKSTVVLCTATQPLLNKVNEDFGKIHFNQNNEIVPNTEQLFNDLKRVEIIDKTTPTGWKTEQIANLVKTTIVDSRNCLIVVNTKKHAQELYNCLSPDNTVFHLSTSMCAAHRMDTFNKIKEKINTNEPFICVSTQLIEAGVDIDFNCVIRFVAGLDSIIQAAGRCNRNGKKAIGKVLVINPSEEKIEALHDIKIGKEITLRIFNEMKSPNSNLPSEIVHPKTLEQYFNYYFYKRADQMCYSVDVGHNDTLFNLLSNNDLAVQEFKRINKTDVPIYFKQAFMSAAEKFQAIDSPTTGIIVPYGEGKTIISELYSQYAIEKLGKLLVKAQRYTVNVFPNVLEKLYQKEAIAEIPNIGIKVLNDERYYHPEFGLSTEITTNYNTNIV